MDARVASRREGCVLCRRKQKETTEIDHAVRPDGIVREGAAAAIVCWHMCAALAVCCFFGRPANSLILILL